MENTKILIFLAADFFTYTDCCGLWLEVFQKEKHSPWA
ncbi:hypothetical protein M211_0100 [Acinetobacter lactucae]|nr:hypothetical protein M211_0100 [Acinetobacter lactucae]